MIDSFTGILGTGAIYGIMVFFKAFQQRNVAHLHYTTVVPTSYALTFSDVFVMSVVSVNAVASESLLAMIPLAFSLGTGSWIGAIIAMKLHAKYIGR